MSERMEGPLRIITVPYVNEDGQAKERHYVGTVGTPEAIAACEVSMHGLSGEDAFARVNGYYYGWCPTCNLLLASGPLLPARSSRD